MILYYSIQHSASDDVRILKEPLMENRYAPNVSDYLVFKSFWQLSPKCSCQYLKDLQTSTHSTDSEKYLKPLCQQSQCSFHLRSSSRHSVCVIGVKHTDRNISSWIIRILNLMYVQQFNSILLQLIGLIDETTKTTYTIQQ